jgi:hypothetical protein
MVLPCQFRPVATYVYYAILLQVWSVAVANTFSIHLKYVFTWFTEAWNVSFPLPNPCDSELGLSKRQRDSATREGPSHQNRHRSWETVATYRALASPSSCPLRALAVAAPTFLPELSYAIISVPPLTQAPTAAGFRRCFQFPPDSSVHGCCLTGGTDRQCTLYEVMGLWAGTTGGEIMAAYQRPPYKQFQ